MDKKQYKQYLRKKEQLKAELEESGKMDAFRPRVEELAEELGVDLEEMKACFAYDRDEVECSALVVAERGCGTVKCPFYKPRGCADYIRFERDGKVLFRKGNNVIEG